MLIREGFIVWKNSIDRLEYEKNLGQVKTFGYHLNHKSSICHQLSCSKCRSSHVFIRQEISTVDVKLG